MMNGRACSSRWAGGASVWMGVCRTSTLSYLRCGSRLTALIIEALQVSDLGRQQKHPHLHTHRHTHIQTTYFHTVKITVQLSPFIPLCPSWLPPIGAYLIANWARYLMTQHSQTLYISINALQNPQHQFMMHTHILEDTLFGTWTKKHQPYSNQPLIRHHWWINCTSTWQNPGKQFDQYQITALHQSAFMFSIY